MKFILIIMIGSWVNPDRIEFDTLEECETAAKKLTYGQIVTACQQGDKDVGISRDSHNAGRTL